MVLGTTDKNEGLIKLGSWINMDAVEVNDEVNDVEGSPNLHSRFLVECSNDTCTFEQTVKDFEGACHQNSSVIPACCPITQKNEWG
jgi:hypothetical protein